MVAAWLIQLALRSGVELELFFLAGEVLLRQPETPEARLQEDRSRKWSGRYDKPVTRGSRRNRPGTL